MNPVRLAEAYITAISATVDSASFVGDVSSLWVKGSAMESDNRNRQQERCSFPPLGPHPYLTYALPIAQGEYFVLLS